MISPGDDMRRRERADLSGQGSDQLIDLFAGIVEMRRDAQPSKPRRRDDVLAIEMFVQLFRRIAVVPAADDGGSFSRAARTDDAIAPLHQSFAQIVAESEQVVFNLLDPDLLEQFDRRAQSDDACRVERARFKPLCARRAFAPRT